MVLIGWFHAQTSSDLAELIYKFNRLFGGNVFVCTDKDLETFEIVRGLITSVCAN
jgi:hypothetical protein